VSPDPLRILPAGDDAVLVELPDLETVHALHRAVLDAGFARDAVPGWCTLLVISDRPQAGLIDLLRAALAKAADDTTAPDAPVVRVPVVYDGSDLDSVALACALTREQVVELHSSARYTVAFLGFSRGFPYLSGLPPQLQRLPRRATPRVCVPAGSVAIALDSCGIYPQDSPGGWHLLGRTSLRLFDERRTPPSLLLPGHQVQFEPVPP
jgi:KipI family sensor histidine kinase inhibitor